MKITHIPKDKLIKIRYEGEEGKTIVLSFLKTIAFSFGIEIEELKQTR